MTIPAAQIRRFRGFARDGAPSVQRERLRKYGHLVRDDLAETLAPRTEAPKAPLDASERLKTARLAQETQLKTMNRRNRDRWAQLRGHGDAA